MERQSNTKNKGIIGIFYFFNTLSLIPETKAAEFANSADLDEVAQHEPHHLDLHFLPSSL